MYAEHKEQIEEHRKRPSHLGEFLHPIRAESNSAALTGCNWLHTKTGRPAADWICAVMTGVMDGGWRESSPADQITISSMDTVEG